MLKNIKDLWGNNDTKDASFMTDEYIANIENELGYKLPASYIALMRMHNGGRLKLQAFPTDEKNSWASDHIAVSELIPIDKLKPCTVSAVDEWGYPDIGIAIGDCPSAGHDMIFFDYRNCVGGEPAVVHVDQEYGYKIIHLADNFEEFINGLRDENEF